MLYKRATAMFDNILQDEHPEKNSWWINELDSLGVDTKSNSNELKDKSRFSGSYQAGIYGRV